MNISEVAKLVGLSSKQIRDYEKSGLLKLHKEAFPVIVIMKKRILERLRFIRHSRDVGFSLQQIHQTFAITG